MLDEDTGGRGSPDGSCRSCVPAPGIDTVDCVGCLEILHAPCRLVHSHGTCEHKVAAPIGAARNTSTTFPQSSAASPMRLYTLAGSTRSREGSRFPRSSQQGSLSYPVTKRLPLSSSFQCTSEYEIAVQVKVSPPPVYAPLALTIYSPQGNRMNATVVNL